MKLNVQTQADASQKRRSARLTHGSKDAKAQKHVKSARSKPSRAAAIKAAMRIKAEATQRSTRLVKSTKMAAKKTVKAAVSKPAADRAAGSKAAKPAVAAKGKGSAKSSSAVESSKGSKKDEKAVKSTTSKTTKAAHAKTVASKTTKTAPKGVSKTVKKDLDKTAKTSKATSQKTVAKESAVKKVKEEKKSAVASVKTEKGAKDKPVKKVTFKLDKSAEKAKPSGKVYKKETKAPASLTVNGKSAAKSTSAKGKATKSTAANNAKAAKSSKAPKGEAAAPAAKSSRKVKKETKASKEEEKKGLNKLYSRLLVDHAKPDVVKSTTAQILKLTGSSKYPVMANKRHISRILQACLKYGDTQVRNAIFENVKKNFTLASLNAHSARFFVKLYHYCNTVAKDFLRKSFFNDHNKSLLFSRYGSDVMDVMYQKLKNKEQLAVLRLYALSNFFVLDKDAMRKVEATGSINQFISIIDESESRESCVETLKTSVIKMIDKAQLTAALSHDLLYIYWKLTDNKEQLIGQLYKVFGQLLSTRNGNTIMCDLFGYADKKMRKSMLKGLRTDFPEAVYNQINVSFLIKAILCTDDTKLSIDCLLRPFQDELQKLVSHQYGHLFVKAVLETPKEVESKTSMKDPAVRQAELQAFLLPLLVELFGSIELKEVIENKYASQVLMSTLRLSGDAEIMQSIVDAVRADCELSLMENIDTFRFIQTLVKKPSVPMEVLCPYGALWPAVKPNVNRILSRKSVFLLVDILEAAMRNGDQQVIADIRETIPVSKLKETCKILEKRNEKHAGLDVLIKLLDK